MTGDCFDHCVGHPEDTEYVGRHRLSTNYGRRWIRTSCAIGDPDFRINLKGGAFR